MPLLQLKDVKTHFPIENKLFKKKKYLKAVNGVNLQIKEGETLAVVGESGCGKSTLARTIVNLTELTEGHIFFEGKNIKELNRKERHLLGKDIQMVFQDPYTSLNPRMKVGDIISAPLKAYKYEGSIAERVKELMQLVGLKESDLIKFPHEFSGGQRQRIGIARALALNPKLIILDEPVSALDVSIQAQIIDLLKDLQEKLNLTYIFITHDLSIIKHIAHQVAVMYLGKIVEFTDVDSFYQEAKHPYTSALLSSIPLPDPEAEKLREPYTLDGELPSAVDLPKGCAFHTRCPFATDLCRENVPPQTKEGSREYACFYPLK